MEDFSLLFILPKNVLPVATFICSDERVGWPRGDAGHVAPPLDPDVAPLPPRGAVRVLDQPVVRAVPDGEDGVVEVPRVGAAVGGLAVDAVRVEAPSVRMSIDENWEKITRIPCYLSYPNFFSKRQYVDYNVQGGASPRGPGLG